MSICHTFKYSCTIMHEHLLQKEKQYLLLYTPICHIHR